jgi:CBS domain-containing protein
MDQWLCERNADAASVECIARRCDEEGATVSGGVAAEMRAADLMSRPVLTVRADDTLGHAAALLSGNHITAAPVLDAAGDLVGIVSEGDLLRARQANGTDAVYQPEPSWTGAAIVADVMTRDVVAMPFDAELSDIAEAMLYHNVHSVPILDGVSEVAGVICRHDLLRAYVRTDDMMELDVQHRLDAYAGGQRIWTATVRDGVAEITGPYVDDVERRVVEVLVRTVTGVSAVKQLAQST